MSLLATARSAVARRLTATPARDVFVVGTAYSGSTLLGNALNAHPLIAHVGEVSRLPAFGIGDRAKVCVVCHTAGRPCPLWSDDVVAEVEAAGPGRAHAILRRRLGGTPVLVDGSKSGDWLRRCLEAPGDLASPFVVIATRSPFAYADSARRRVGWNPAHAATVWRDTVLGALHLVARYGLPHLVVRYEDLARDPEHVLGRVVDSLALAPDAAMLRFWEHDVHSVGGNASAYVWYEAYRRHGRFDSPEEREIGASYATRGFGGWADEKWRTALDADDRAAVLGIADLVTTATAIGYDLAALANDPVNG